MFKRLARHTYHRLVEMKIDIKDFYADNSCMDPSLRHVAGNFFEECFSATSNMAAFWGKLNQFWDFYNFELLQHIMLTMFDDIDDSLLREMEENERETFIEKIGSLRKDMETYEKEITDFSSKTNVCDFFRIWPFGMPKPEEARLREVVLKVEKNWEDYTLLDIKKTANIIAQAFFLPRHFLLIGGVKKGSVSILWYVPPSVARLLEKRVAEVKPGFFIANGVQSISINDVQLYPLTPTSTSHGDPTSTPHGDPTSTPHGDPMSMPHGDPTSTPHGDPTSMPHGDPTSTPHGDPTSMPHGDPTSTPHCDPDPTPTPHGDPTSTPHGDPTPTPHGDPTSTPHGDPTSTLHGDPTSSPHGDPTSMPHGDPTPTPHGHPTSTPHGYPTPTLHGDPTPTPHGDPTSTPHGEYFWL